MTSPNTRRIAKNTVALYFRMLLVMAVSLFTVRVVLQALGAADYGIYNVVSGVVSMISFLSIAMSTATGRFLTFELERNNEAEFAKIFSMSMTIYLGIVCLLVVFSETVGLWFVNHQLVIPQERMPAANWAYQCAVETLITSILVIPYQSAVIAHEKMGVYAYLGVAEG
ncbi:MAG TPA: lipopolysaccharide biosynthesis protein, partial [Candidatus Omnitrophota bacterium]|nr:lipopolysaccharide biosynthesis protein [Candidatus Omnitrophota bacterium]